MSSSRSSNVGSKEAISEAEHNRSSGQQTNTDKAKATDHKKQVSSRLHRARILRNNARELQADRSGLGTNSANSTSATNSSLAKNRKISTSSSSTTSSKVTFKDGSEESPQVINWTRENNNNNNSRGKDQALVHTDQLNTTSPLLYVSSPNNNNNKIRGDHYQAAESRVAILAASYKQPPANQQAPSSMDNVDEGATNDDQTVELDPSTASESRRQLLNTADNAALTPRLVVINLEVGSSSATITWALSLHNQQLTEREQQVSNQTAAKRRDNTNQDDGSAQPSWPQLIDPSPLEQIEGDNDDNKRLRQQKRHSVVDNSSADKQRRDEIKATIHTFKLADDKLVSVDKVGNRESEHNSTTGTIAGPQQADNLALSTTAAATTTGQAKRFVVKRDTIRVTPTLNRRTKNDEEDNDEADESDEADASRSSTTPDIDIRLKETDRDESIADDNNKFKATTTNKRRALAAESDNLDDNALLAPLDQEQDLRKTPQASRTTNQSITSHNNNNNTISSSSRLEFEPSREELQRQQQVKNSSSINLNSSDMTINRRLQLARLSSDNLRPINSSVVTNRRPPIRSLQQNKELNSTMLTSSNNVRRNHLDSMQNDSSTPLSYITPVTTSSQRHRKSNATLVVVPTSSTMPAQRDSTTSRRKAKLLTNSSTVASSTSEPPMIKVQPVLLNRISSSTTAPPLVSSASTRGPASSSPPLASASSTTTSTTSTSTTTTTTSTTTTPLPSSSASSTTEKSSREEWTKKDVETADFSAAASSISDQVGVTPSRSNLPAPEKNNQFSSTPIVGVATTENTEAATKSAAESITAKSSTRLATKDELSSSTQSPASIARQLIPVLFQKTTPKPNLNHQHQPVNKANSNNNGESQRNSPTTFTSNKLPIAGSELHQPVPDVSKWLIRLRRFASNEVDIVKVVVNNISQSMRNWSPNQKPVLRFISFKNLEPSSAYEICIESASPNQQVGDKFQILDANHFLKCHDSTDVELHNITLPISTTKSSNDSNNLDNEDSMVRNRMVNIRHMSEEVSSDNGKSKSTTTTTTNKKRRRRRRRATLSNDQSADNNGDKMKSLCKEFFTLPSNSPDKINFGQVETAAGSRVQAIGDTRSLKPVDLFSIDDPQFKNYTNVVGSQLSNLRRPKSLNNKALKSHIELLEISDLSAPNHANAMFEITASSSSNAGLSAAAAAGNHNLNPNSNNNKLSSFASDTTNNYIARDAVLDSRATQQPGLINASPHRVDYLSQSVIPIVGCVFGLIFIITLANILLNAISCRSSPSSSSSAAIASRLQRRRRQQGATGGGGSILDRSGGHTLNSFYSDNSDHSNTSNTSQSRIVVVGKNGEPFAATSAYFEVPMDRSRAANHHDHLSLDLASSSGNSSRGKHSSSYLLSADQARFPLGPSFEGDEKHNADMVGLARKNYDNFINHIYNADTSKDSESFEPTNVRAFEKRPSSHRHCHHHFHHISRQQQQQNNNNRNESCFENATEMKPQENHLLADLSRESEMERYSRSKKQRIRFDKINPIYNMDGLYTTSTRLNRRKSPMNQVSSFGHTNAALIKEEGDDVKNDKTNNKESLSSSNDEDNGDNSNSDQHSSSTESQQCPLCCEQNSSNVTKSNNNKEDEETQQQHQNTSAPADSSLVVGCDSENCENSSPYFTCCLDKQKQRFHRQQQQLEKVMTKNGSLVPQPFINPSGPPRCASPTCESVVREHEQISAEPTSNDISIGQDLSSSTSTVKVLESSVVASDSMMSQHERSDQEIIEVKPSADNSDSRQQDQQQERNFFMFGDIPSPPPPPPLPATNSEETSVEPIKIKAYNNTNNVVTSSLPSTLKESTSPPEPPKLPNLSKTIAKESDKKPVVVSVGAMGSNSTDSNGRGARETIDKTDFDQRRNQLASKLQLVGIIKPG